MKQFDTLPLQNRHIEHMHEGVWLKKRNLTKWQLRELRQLFPYIAFVYAWILPSWAYQLLPQQFDGAIWWSNLILCRCNVDTLNICVKEFGSEKIILACTDSTETFFSKPRSAGLNYNLQSFFTDSYCAGYLISIAYWLFSFLQVTRTTVKAWMSLNFCQIPSLTTELAALKHLKNECIMLWAL